MKTSHSNISRATVYNTVELLAQCGLLIKRNFGEKRTHYESNIKKTHDHLICTNCGSIKEFSEPKIQKIVKDLSQEIGFEVTGYSLNIFGKCTNQKCEHHKNDK
jgi:Fur family transcriptional regulator, ferric uptake regulator